jgi:hypothetical protein
MDDKTESAVITLAAIVVLLMTSVDPWIGIRLAVAFQLALSIFHFARGTRGSCGGESALMTKPGN